MVNAYVRRKQLEHKALAAAIVNALGDALGQGKGKERARRVPPRALLRMTGAGLF